MSAAIPEIKGFEKVTPLVSLAAIPPAHNWLEVDVVPVLPLPAVTLVAVAATVLSIRERVNPLNSAPATARAAAVEVDIVTVALAEAVITRPIQIPNSVVEPPASAVPVHIMSAVEAMKAIWLDATVTITMFPFVGVESNTRFRDVPAVPRLLAVLDWTRAIAMSLVRY